MGKNNRKELPVQSHLNLSYENYVHKNRSILFEVQYMMNNQIDEE